MGYVITLGLALALGAPLVAIYRRQAAGKRVKPALVAQIAAFFAMCVLVCALGIGSAYATAGAAGAAGAGGGGGVGNADVIGEAVAPSAAGAADEARPLDPQAGLGMLSAALATGVSCIGAGIAVAAAASAAMGAISENEQNFGKALIFVALAEGVALYGFLISFLILGKI
jgi:V/A-type H+-transporting ATPase subunit K